MKNSNTSIIGNRTRDLPACSTMSKQTAPSRVPLQITMPRLRPNKFTNVCKA